MIPDADDPSYPVVNVEEFIGKTVGRRKLGSPTRAQRSGREFVRLAGLRVCEPGVFRFRSHEEADAWMRQMELKRAQRAAKS